MLRTFLLPCYLFFLLPSLFIFCHYVVAENTSSSRKQATSSRDMQESSTILTTTSSSGGKDDDTRSFTRIMLDDMYQYWNLTDNPSHDFEELLKCFQKWEVQDDSSSTTPSIESAVDAQWKGFYEYYLSNGTDNDYWGIREPTYSETSSD